MTDKMFFHLYSAIAECRQKSTKSATIFFYGKERAQLLYFPQMWYNQIDGEIDHQFLLQRFYPMCLPHRDNQETDGKYNIIFVPER